jgi:1,4-alpha-glucan branching enzyme
MIARPSEDPSLARELDQIVSLEHGEPHHVLGAHPVPANLPGGPAAVVRIFRPDAARVTVLAEGHPPVEAVQIRPGGLFEAWFPGSTQLFAYRYTVDYPAIGEQPARSFTLRDPYAFLPTLGELDVYLASEGRHLRLDERMGAHLRDLGGVRGVSFAVWAPQARRVSVVGEFNGWDGRLHPMRRIGQSGIWELFIPDLGEGDWYKYEVIGEGGERVLKTDPFAFETELRPGTAGRVHTPPGHAFRDEAWLVERAITDPLRRPMSIYEVHLGGFARSDERGPGAVELGGGYHSGRFLTYRELAPRLVEHVKRGGFTHVELLPITEHPYDPSWGYQTTGYFSPTSRFGPPQDLAYLVDELHLAGIGVLLDWVPAHFTKDQHGLRRFDGSALYEHLDARQGEHAQWGTMIFNYGRSEVKNFLLASALHWLRTYHFDGLRVDAVASMLYLDYGREGGGWVPNQYGGRENLEAAAFLRELNEVVHREHPGAMVIAEESTSWPGVSRPVYVGGLGFTFKWNMGWMHDTLDYFALDPAYRRYHHNKLTFGFLYAWSENYVLPLSHDEVVHLKRSLLDKMPGDRWQKFANLRALYGWMWAHPGKKLVFMGGEFGQWNEFSEAKSLDWHLLNEPDHAGLLRLVGDLNMVYRDRAAFWQDDVDPRGFQWIDANDADQSVASILRFANRGEPGERVAACVLNATPVPRYGYRVGVPRGGDWVVVINTDQDVYGGSNMSVPRVVRAEEWSNHGQPYSVAIDLPPLATLWLEPG